MTLNVIYCYVQIHNDKMPMLFCLLLMYTSEEDHLFVIILIILTNGKLKLKVQCLKILQYCVKVYYFLSESQYVFDI